MIYLYYYLYYISPYAFGFFCVIQDREDAPLAVVSGFEAQTPILDEDD